MSVTFKQYIHSFKEKLFADVIEIPAVMQSSYFPGLDGLRGISIIIVIAAHFSWYSSYNKYFYGDIGVEIFFVISGFLITSLLFKEKVKNKTVSYKNFYIRRFLRIVPVAYLLMIILILLNKLLRLDIPNIAFLTSFLYLKNIPFRNSVEWYTGHFWSLSVEEQFYLCFPFFIVAKTNKFICFAVGLIFIIPVLNFFVYNYIAAFNSHHIFHVLIFGFLTLLGKGTVSILVGSLFSILLFKKIIVVDELKSNFLLSFCLLLFGCISLSPQSYLNIENLSVFLFPFIIGYVILLNLKGKNLLRHILDNRLLAKIGIISYSLYIWQQLFSTKQKWNFFKYSDTIVVRLILLFAVAYLSFTYFERFFLKYKTRYKSF